MRIPPFKIERYFARYEFDTPYLLGSSDCESMRVDELLGFEPGAERELRDLWLGYTEYPGDPGLRRAVAALYTTIGEDQVLVQSRRGAGVLHRSGGHGVTTRHRRRSLF